MDVDNTRDAGSKVTAYAVIDADGHRHSVWFLEGNATALAKGVGGTVVRLGEVSEAVRPVEHNKGVKRCADIKVKATRRGVATAIHCARKTRGFTR